MKIEHIKASYNSVATKYTDAFFNELDHKPLDRHLLEEFTSKVRYDSKICDLGCGPGHISRFLKDRDKDVFGIDLSNEMLNIAKVKNPDIDYKIGNMMDLELQDNSLGGVVSFYSIVHCTINEVEGVFKEVWRVLEKDGLLFLSFHSGTQILHVDSLFDEKVNLDYMFFDTEEIVGILKRVGFRIMEAVTRLPYEDYEYASKRGYIICQKVIE